MFLPGSNHMIWERFEFWKYHDIIKWHCGFSLWVRTIWQYQLWAESSGKKSNCIYHLMIFCLIKEAGCSWKLLFWLPKIHFGAYFAIPVISLGKEGTNLFTTLIICSSSLSWSIRCYWFCAQRKLPSFMFIITRQLSSFAGARWFTFFIQFLIIIRTWKLIFYFKSLIFPVYLQVAQNCVQWVPILLNLGVHLVMYYYYHLASEVWWWWWWWKILWMMMMTMMRRMMIMTMINEPQGKSPVWKKYVTSIQISQFVLALAACTGSLNPSEKRVNCVSWFSLFFFIFILLQFRSLWHARIGLDGNK